MPTEELVIHVPPRTAGIRAIIAEMDETKTIEPHPTPVNPVSHEISPPFHLATNTQEMELRTLRNQQPPEILEADYSYPFYRTLPGNSLRNQLKEKSVEIRRLVYSKIAYQNAPEKHKKILANVLRGGFLSRQIAFIRDPDIELQGTYTYEAYAEALREYTQAKNKFINDRITFAPLQARYNQQCAMIRQKPRNTKEINTQEILDIVSQWKNVWGIAIHQAKNEWLKIRVGLNDIVMCESAEESRYDYEAEITLAPFLFTIKLNSDGTFVCSSSGENTLGLSRENDPGDLDYDIHPHQLSDTPCFGTFGQSFIDMANTGDIISLISGIIAFYSQYNSQDSAGINARRYHPAFIGAIRDPDEYKDRLIKPIVLSPTFNGQYRRINEEKLTGAIAAYRAYHEEQRYKSPPERDDTRYCASCEDADVTEDFWSSHDGERICEMCWNDHYCSNCERHVEDCVCDPDEY